MKITKDYLIYAMSKDNPPICRVPTHTDIYFETCDCFEDQLVSGQEEFNQLDWNRINPATGPVYVEGAKKGDVLKVTIKKIVITRNYAVMVTMPNLGLLGDELTAAEVKIIRLEEGQAHLPGGIKVSIQPMIGVIGVAPAGDAISCGTPGAHGGNMDAKIIKEGATLWLPVNVDGALFALGDLHAGMGDGEVAGCGLEVPGEVIVSFEVVKNVNYPLPMVTDCRAVYTLASELTVDSATTRASQNMASLLTENSDLSLSDALSIMSIAGNLAICQVVDPLKTSRFALPRKVFDKLAIVL